MAALATHGPSHACCALLVSAAGPAPVRGVTSVVALRSGRSTVLTVATEVIGPAAGVALVVPVPGHGDSMDESCQRDVG